MFNKTKSKIKFNEVLKEDFVSLAVSEDFTIFKEIYHPSTRNKTVEDIKEYHLKKIDLLIEKRPEGMFVDLRRMEISVDMDVMEWYNNHVGKALNENGLLKMAQMKLDNKLAQASIEFANTEFTMPFELKYFDSESKAMDWLLVGT